METKKCPFCAEEIRVDAIKCKHCGEFLQRNDDGIDRVVPQVIAKQNFVWAIVVAVLAIILTWMDTFNNIDDQSKESWVITNWFIILNIWTSFYLRKYLKNFRNEKASFWVTWYIVMLFVFAIFTWGIKSMSLDNNAEDIDISGLEYLLIRSIIVIELAAMVVSIMFGMALMKIKNDFVGLLKQLGMSFAFLAPIIFALDIILIFNDSESAPTIGAILDIIPFLILIVIFFRARKYVPSYK